MKTALTLLLTLLLLGFSITQAQDAPAISSDGYLRSTRLGINHISGVEEVTSAARYQKALELGAGWNRWPIYWDRVETKAGVFDWSGYDRLVSDDLGQGLGINAILLGRPAFYADDNRIKGLQEPFFADGTDTPSQCKKLNPKNYWGRQYQNSTTAAAVLGATGTALAVTGAVLLATRKTPRARATLAPWGARGAGGLVFTGRF